MSRPKCSDLSHVAVESEPRDGEALEVALEMSGEDTDDSSPRARPTCVTTETSVDGTSSDIGSYIESIDHGALEDCASGSETKLALPRDYPEVGWSVLRFQKQSRRGGGGDVCRKCDRVNNLLAPLWAILAQEVLRAQTENGVDTCL